MPAVDCKAGAGTALAKTEFCLQQDSSEDNQLGPTASPELNLPLTSLHVQFRIATLMPRYLDFSTISEGLFPDVATSFTILLITQVL